MTKSAKMGFDPVEDAIAEEIIKSNISEGDAIVMDLKKDAQTLSIKITNVDNKPKEG